MIDVCWQVDKYPNVAICVNIRNPLPIIPEGEARPAINKSNKK